VWCVDNPALVLEGGDERFAAYRTARDALREQIEAELFEKH
jgi:hypothetical protein